MNSGRQHADRLASRLAFMNAENDRLKKIIMDYERRFAGDATSGRSNLDIEDCSDDSQPLSMGVGKRQDRGRLGAKQSNPQDSRVIASLKQQLEKVQSDYQRAMKRKPPTQKAVFFRA
jgi:hypothetical protein